MDNRGTNVGFTERVLYDKGTPRKEVWFGETWHPTVYQTNEGQTGAGNSNGWKVATLSVYKWACGNSTLTIASIKWPRAGIALLLNLNQASIASQIQGKTEPTMESKGSWLQRSIGCHRRYVGRLYLGDADAALGKWIAGPLDPE